MAFGKDDIIEALRIRYDHHSAGAMFEIARQRAELDDKAAFDHGELRAFRTALQAVGDRVGNVLVVLDRMLDSAPATPAKPESKPAAPAKAAKAAPAEPAIPAAAPSAPATETTVVLTGVDAKDDEQVLICGALDALGEWDPERARALNRKGDEWLTTVTLPPDAKIAFKFLRRTGDGKVVWETGDDRFLVPGARLEAKWR